MKIFKFGGASVKDSFGVRNILNVLKNTGFKNTFIVVSAMGKTTNALEQVVRCYFEDKNQLFSELASVRSWHYEIIDDLFFCNVSNPPLNDGWPNGTRLSMYHNKIITP